MTNYSYENLSGPRIVYHPSTDQFTLPVNKKTRYAEDRHIPLRSCLIPVHQRIIQSNLLEESANPAINSQAALAYSRHLYETMMQVPLGTSLLRFCSKAVRPVEGLNQKKIIPLNGRLDPCKLIAAPGLKDDFYADLIDWSSSNNGQSMFTVALTTNEQTKIYFASMHDMTIDRQQECAKFFGITSLRLRNLSRELIIGQEGGHIRRIDVEHQKVIHHVRILEAELNLDTNRCISHRIAALATHPDEQIILAGSQDKYIRLLDFRQPKPIVGKFLGHSAEVCTLQWSPLTQYFASGGNDNKFKVWDIRVSQATRFQDLPFVFGSNINAAVRAQSFSPTQPSLLANGGGTFDRMLRVWDIAQQRLVAHLDTGSQVTKLFWSRDGNYIVTTHGHNQCDMKIWRLDGTRLTLAKQYARQAGRIIHAAQSPSGQYLMTGVDESIKFWDLFTPKATVIPNKKRSVLDLENYTV